MLDFLTQIVGFFETAINLIISLVTGLFNLLKMLPIAVNFVGNSVAFLPTVVVSFVLAGVAFSVILMIVGRSS